MSDTPTAPVEEAPPGYAQSGVSDGALNRRLLGIAATILAEIVVIALLLTLGWNLTQGEPEAPVVTTLEARNASSEAPPAPEEAPPEESREPAEPVPQPPDPQPIDTPQPPLPTPLDPPPIVLPIPAPAPPPPPPAQPQPDPAPKTPAKPPRVYGPPDTGGSSFSNDSVRVGTAPNGEPMYAARWYREPTRQELAGYLSTATGPASALIVCKTVPDFYVEDCELLGESPRGSQMGRAVLAAAWQFRVRPAIIGGKSQVGSWVRIRIDYTRAIRP
ncbi:MAG: hypothetical protein AAFQ90_05745 [Pseudomonadota bacterium]